jgi:hypothetical protein
MSPNVRNRAGRATAFSNLYTIILAFAFCTVVATAVFVAYKCYSQYGTIFKLPKPPLWH